MKAKTFLLMIVVAALAGTSGWFMARPERGAGKPAVGARKILHYQSPMHPWIISAQPGRCTICGMNLEPVYEGERGFTAEGGLVTLGSNTIQVINVQTEVVTNRPLVRTLRVAGTIEDDDTKHRRLSAAADGRVEKLFVNYVGAEVVAGQPLAVFYSPILLAAESEYLTAAGQKSGADLSANLREERRQLVEAAAERLRRLGYAETQITALTNRTASDARTQVLAPVTGTVVSRNVYEGQYMKEGDLLFELADFSTLWFQFDAYERDLGWLRVGQTVDVTTPTWPGRIFSAPIAFIDPNLNEMTRSAKVRVELPNPVVEEDGRKQRLLYHRMFADGSVQLKTPDVVAVPRSAVLSAGTPLVYVEVSPGVYEQRTVKLGRRGDDFWEVLEGVSAGERVVTAANFLIDAQAQLNASVTTGTRTNAGTAPLLTSLEKLTPGQQDAARDFLARASGFSGALAADNLALFNTLAPRIHADIPKLLDVLGPVPALRPALQKLEEGGHLDRAKDLAAARRTFLPFSMATVELAKLLRTQDAFKSVKIFNCPMVNRALPGVARNGQWIQLEAPLRNPFFGAEMLECGTELKP